LVDLTRIGVSFKLKFIIDKVALNLTKITKKVKQAQENNKIQGCPTKKEVEFFSLFHQEKPFIPVIFN